MFWIFVVAGVLCATAQGSPIPRPTDHAKVARELVHKASWTAFGTISSTFPKFEGFPMVSVKSVADSPLNGPSSGNIYLLLTDLDFSTQDLKKNNKVTLLFSKEQDLSCSKVGVDPMEPTCARISVTGSVVEIDEQNKEHSYAKESFISRHPAAGQWIEAHLFKLYKVKIEQIVVLDWYGGLHVVTPQQYYAVKPSEL